MYLMLTFVIVYVFMKSYCETDADSVSRTVMKEDGVQYNYTLYQTDVYAIKTARTATIFGGVYGLFSNKGMYLFNGQDSEDYYMRLHNLPDNYLTQYLSHINGISPQKYREMAQTYLNMKQLTVVIVGDADKIRHQLNAVRQLEGVQEL